MELTTKPIHQHGLQLLIKELRKNLDNLQKKFKDRNVHFDTDDFKKKDNFNNR